MSLVRAYDAVAALFCVIWFAVYTQMAMSHDGSPSIELALSTVLAFWGRRSRIWAAALGGGLSIGNALIIAEYADQRQVLAAGGHNVADDPTHLYIVFPLMLFGAIASGVVAAFGKELARRASPQPSPTKC